MYFVPTAVRWIVYGLFILLRSKKPSGNNFLKHFSKSEKEKKRERETHTHRLHWLVHHLINIWKSMKYCLLLRTLSFVVPFKFLCHPFIIPIVLGHKFHVIPEMVENFNSYCNVIHFLLSYAVDTSCRRKNIKYCSVYAENRRDVDKYWFSHTLKIIRLQIFVPQE